MQFINLLHVVQTYLEIAAQCGTEECYTEYLDCLCNSYDPRTISVIDTFMQVDSEGGAQEQLHCWTSFHFLLQASLQVDPLPCGQDVLS